MSKLQLNYDDDVEDENEDNTQIDELFLQFIANQNKI
jgi:hypothetical protein